jgi:hypothetical protein
MCINYICIGEYGCTRPEHLVTWVTEHFMVALNTVSIIVSVFFLHARVCISSHVPSRWHQMSVIRRSLQNCGFSTWNPFNVSHLVPRIWRWLLYFLRICGYLYRRSYPLSACYVFFHGLLSVSASNSWCATLNGGVIHKWWIGRIWDWLWPELLCW